MWTISWRSLFRNIHSRSNLWFDYFSATRWPTMPWARRPSRWWRGTSWPCSSPPTSPRSRARRGWTNQSLWQIWNQSWSWYVAQVLGQWLSQSLTKRIDKFALSRCVGAVCFCILPCIGIVGCMKELCPGRQCNIWFVPCGWWDEAACGRCQQDQGRVWEHWQGGNGRYHLISSNIKNQYTNFILRLLYI